MFDWSGLDTTRSPPSDSSGSNAQPGLVLVDAGREREAIEGSQAQAESSYLSQEPTKAIGIAVMPKHQISLVRGGDMAPER